VARPAAVGDQAVESAAAENSELFSVGIRLIIIRVPCLSTACRAVGAQQGRSKVQPDHPSRIAGYATAGGSAHGGVAEAQADPDDVDSPTLGMLRPIARSSTSSVGFVGRCHGRLRTAALGWRRGGISDAPTHALV
jgi:hypothetical protein